MKRYIRSADQSLSDLVAGLIRKRSIKVEYPIGRIQSVIKYEDPDTGDSYALLNSGASNFIFAKLTPVTKTKYQVADIIEEITEYL